MPVFVYGILRKSRRREMDELINALPSAERDMLRAYFISTQPSSPDTAAAANRGGPSPPMRYGYLSQG